MNNPTECVAASSLDEALKSATGEANKEVTNLTKKEVEAHIFALLNDCDNPLTLRRIAERAEEQARETKWVWERRIAEAYAMHHRTTNDFVCRLERGPRGGMHACVHDSDNKLCAGFRIRTYGNGDLWRIA